MRVGRFVARSLFALSMMVTVCRAVAAQPSLPETIVYGQSVSA